MMRSLYWNRAMACGHHETENISVTRLKQFGSKFHVLGLALVLAISSLVLGGHAVAADTAQGGDVVVTAVKGDVSVTMRGQPRGVKPGTVMDLAASVRTGANSSLQLRQGNTTFSVASDSVVDLPAGAAAGDPIDRVMQTRGNVLYDVGKRGARKLRVETPYLVAVVKGTQFNVAAQDDSSVISLFEGLLEIQASDGSDIVELKAGEIAIRGRADRTIRVIRMDTGESIARTETRHAPVGSGSNDDGTSTPGTTRPVSPVEAELARVPPATNDGGTPQPTGTVDVSTSTGTLNVGTQSAVGIDVNEERTSLAADLGLQAGDKTVVGVGLTTDVGAGSIDVSLGAGVDVGGAASVDVGADLGVDLGSGAVDVGVSAGVDVGGTSADLGVDAGVDLGGGTVDLGVDAGIDAGGVAAVDVGIDAGVDLGAGTVDLGVDAGVDVGGAAVDLGADVGADLGSGSVDLGLDAGVDVGGTPVVDLGLDAGVDAGSGAVDLGVDAGVAGVDAGVDAGIDLGAGTVGADVSVGGLDLGLDVDLGSGTIDLGVGTVTTTTPPSSGSSPPASGGGGLLGGVGGIVGGLLGGGN
jgi:hypothetical protein